MGRYLVVAHQTVGSPLLLDRLARIARDDPRAEFTVLVPATHPKHIVRREPGEPLFVWDEHDSYELAAERAEEARMRLEDALLRVRDAVVGDESPLLAIDDLLRADPHGWDGIVLSTLPLSESRWTRMNLREQAESRFDIPVLHICEGRENARWSRRRTAPARRRFRRVLVALSGRRAATLAGVLALSYLAGAAVLALAVDRQFFVNDAIALAVFAIFFLGLFAAERARAFVPDRAGASGEWRSVASPER